MDLEKKKVFLINIIYWAVILAVAYLIFKYLLVLVMPFLLALFFSSILRPVSSFLVKKLHFMQKPAAILVALIFFGFIGFLFVLLGIKLVSAVADIFSLLPGVYQSVIEPGLTNLMQAIEDFASRFDISVLETLNEIGPEIISSLGNAVYTVSGTVGAWATAFVVGLPKFLLSVIVMIIATFFMSMDYRRMTEFILRQLPEKAREIALEVRGSLIRVVVRYGRSYLIIMAVTFVEITIGMFILGYKNAPAIGIVVAAFDILPILGTGMILGPWAIIELIQGHYISAVGLIVLYLVVTVVRQVMEARVIGSHVGLHPLVIIMAIFIGGSLFGAVGLFGLPITLALLQSLNEEGVITLFRRRPPSGEGEAGEEKPAPDDK